MGVGPWRAWAGPGAHKGTSEHGDQACHPVRLGLVLRASPADLALLRDSPGT